MDSTQSRSQNLCGAKLILGGTAVTAPPFFEIAGRLNVLYWHPDSTRLTCEIGDVPLVMTLADFTDSEFDELYAPPLRIRQVGLSSLLPCRRILRRGYFLSDTDAGYQRDRVRSSERRGGGCLVKTACPHTPLNLRVGCPPGRLWMRHSFR